MGRYGEDGGHVYAATCGGDGNVTAESGSKPDTFGQNTKEADGHGTELVYFGQRYYDPEAGVWLSRDPLGFEDGLKLYCYVHRNPWSMYDPDG